jgi:HSP20 family molecular chaperone IbpA
MESLPRNEPDAQLLSSYTYKIKKMDAQYKDGILTLTLPKTEEKKPKEFEVKVSE